MTDALVSIIIPVYNGEDYLREAIDSALSQTYQNIEILVINDGSTDSTEMIAQSYGDKIRYFKKDNGGVSSALNLGICEMRGEYFSWLSHDDVYEPEKIQLQLEMLSEYNDNCLIANCEVSYINSDSNYITSVHRNGLPTLKMLSGEYVLHYLLKHGSFNGCALLIPKRAFEVCGFFNEDLRYAQDALMWYMIFSKRFSLIVHPKALIKNRVHQNQQTQLHSDRLYTDGVMISDIILPIFDKISTKQDDFVYEHLLRSLLHGNDASAKKCIVVLKNRKRLYLSRRLRILFMQFYGKIRPLIRKLYYYLFRKMKTE